MYKLAVRKGVDKVFVQPAKTDPARMRRIHKKVERILETPYHFKPLRTPLRHLRRVHVGRSYALLYSIDEESGLVVIEDLAHHDEVYRAG